MSKTRRAEKTDRQELDTFPLPARAIDPAATEPYLGPVNAPVERWPQARIDLERRLALRDPDRRRGRIADHGILAGTVEGAHRYYFSATRGLSIFVGTVIANRRADVARFVREELRGVAPLIGRDLLILRGVLA